MSGGSGRRPSSVVGARHVRIGGATRGARGQQLLRQPAQVLDQRELQHARPRPQLADRQRRDPLVAVQELDQLLAIETAVAVPDQFDRNRVDARLAAVLARGQRRQRARIGARQVPADVGDLGGDQMKVVEEPVGRRHDELAGANIVGERPVGGAEHADVVLEAREGVAGTTARIGIDREAGGQRERPLLEPLDAEQLVAQRLLGNRRHTPQLPRRRPLHERGWTLLAVGRQLGRDRQAGSLFGIRPPHGCFGEG